jgi:hypothetical protein
VSARLPEKCGPKPPIAQHYDTGRYEYLYRGEWWLGAIGQERGTCIGDHAMQEKFSRAVNDLGHFTGVAERPP